MLLKCGVGEDSWDPLGHKEFKPVSPKGNQSWIFIGKTDAEAETPILGAPDVKSWFIGKYPDAGKDWRWKKETTEDEMVGQHHCLSGHEFEKVPGDGEGQGSLACCSPWGHRAGHDWESEQQLSLLFSYYSLVFLRKFTCLDFQIYVTTSHPNTYYIVSSGDEI